MFIVPATMVEGSPKYDAWATQNHCIKSELHFLGIVKKVCLVKFTSLLSISQNAAGGSWSKSCFFQFELLRFINTCVFVRSQSGKVIIIIPPCIKATTVFHFSSERHPISNPHAKPRCRPVRPNAFRFQKLASFRLLLAPAEGGATKSQGSP